MTTMLDDDGQQWNRGGERRASSPSALFASIGLAITIASLLFTAGYNWRRITEVADAHDALAKTVVNDYMRKDVQQEQNVTMTLQLNAIRDQIATLQRLTERRNKE